jgi:hypothetical protein
MPTPLKDHCPLLSLSNSSMPGRYDSARTEGSPAFTGREVRASAALATRNSGSRP